MSSLVTLLDKAYHGVLVKHYPKGQTIIHQGDQALEVLLLKRGIIKMYDMDTGGNEKILHLFNTPSIIPFTFFTGKEQALLWNYAALTDCDISGIPNKVLVKKMMDDPELTVALRNWFATEVQEILVRLSSLGKSNTRDKVHTALKLLAIRHSAERNNGWWRVNFPVNHQLLADLTGMTRESAATIMKSLKDEKIIRQPRMTVLEINLVKLTKASDGVAPGIFGISDVKSEKNRKGRFVGN